MEKRHIDFFFISFQLLYFSSFNVNEKLFTLENPPNVVSFQNCKFFLCIFTKKLNFHALHAMNTELKKPSFSPAWFFFVIGTKLKWIKINDKSTVKQLLNFSSKIIIHLFRFLHKKTHFGKFFFGKKTRRLFVIALWDFMHCRYYWIDIFSLLSSKLQL